MDATATELAEVLSAALGVTVSPGDGVAMSSTPAWDSFRHIEIIMMVEERFGISFDPQDIPLLTSQSLLEDKIRELTA